MNRVFVAGTGICKSSAEHAGKTEFRKATQNMILAQVSLEEANLPLAGRMAENGTDALGLVLGTSHGELDVTVGFLETLAESGLARPILFQNSLHNSTSGYLAMVNRITGPMLTLSHSFFSGEDAISTGQLLLQEGQCHFCLVTGVETQVAKVMPDGQKPNLAGVTWSEGAATVLLCDEWGLDSARLSSFAELLSIRIVQKSNSGTAPTESYESDAVELWVRALRESAFANNGATQTLRLPKPDGSGSEIEWRR